MPTIEELSREIELLKNDVKVLENAIRSGDITCKSLCVKNEEGETAISLDVDDEGGLIAVFDKNGAISVFIATDKELDGLILKRTQAEKMRSRKKAVNQ